MSPHFVRASLSHTRHRGTSSGGGPDASLELPERRSTSWEDDCPHPIQKPKNWTQQAKQVPRAASRYWYVVKLLSSVNNPK